MGAADGGSVRGTPGWNTSADDTRVERATSRRRADTSVHGGDGAAAGGSVHGVPNSPSANKFSDTGNSSFNMRRQTSPRGSYVDRERDMTGKKRAKELDREFRTVVRHKGDIGALCMALPFLRKGMLWVVNSSSHSGRCLHCGAQAVTPWHPFFAGTAVKLEAACRGGRSRQPAQRNQGAQL